MAAAHVMVNPGFDAPVENQNGLALVDGKRSLINPEEFMEHSALMGCAMHLSHGNRDDACDLLQDTFVRAWKSWQQFEGRSQEKAWLFRIMINLHTDHMRALRGKRMKDAQDFDVRISLTPDSRVNIVRDLLRQEREGLIRSALCVIPPDFRVAVELSNIQGFSDEGVADVLGLTVSGAKSRIRRAREALKAAFKNMSKKHRSERPQPNPLGAKTVEAHVQKIA